MVELARFVIHEGTDPTTLPQSKVDWVPTSIPPIKTPVLRYKRYISKLEVIVEGPDQNDVKTQFDTCVQNAAIKGLIIGLVAAYVSGGTAGLSAAMTTFVVSADACVEAALGRAVDITAKTESSGYWSEWE